MATQFQKQFQQSNKELFASRGEIVSKQMTNASEQIKQELNNKKFELEMEIKELMDFGKTSTTSLDIKKPESYMDFIRGLNNKQKELALIEIDIEIHERTHKQWFTDESENKD